MGPVSYTHLLDPKWDFLPLEICERYGLCCYVDAVQKMHFPEEKASFYRARKRVVFDEFLIFILSLRQMKAGGERVKNHFPLQRRPEIDKFIDSLPYELTNAQKKVWEEICTDLEGKYVMSRLVQGDVGLSLIHICKNISVWSSICSCSWIQ